MKHLQYSYCTDNTNTIYQNTGNLGITTSGGTITLGGGNVYTTNSFNASTTAHITGNLTSEGFLTVGAGTSTFTGGIYANDLRTNLPSCNTLDTDASGALICGTDEQGGASGAPNLIYRTLGTTKFYTAS